MNGITLGIKKTENDYYKVGWVIGKKFLWWNDKVQSKKEALEILSQTCMETKNKYVPWIEL